MQFDEIETLLRGGEESNLPTKSDVIELMRRLTCSLTLPLVCERSTFGSPRISLTHVSSTDICDMGVVVLILDSFMLKQCA